MAPTQPTIVLFDIDGTLILTGGAGRRAFTRAFAEVLQRSDAVGGFNFGGMTDRGIARLGLAAVQREHDEKLVDALLEAYVDALKDELARGTPYRIMPNVRELVAELGQRVHVGIGLGTGNLKRGAEAKLRHGGLWDLFTFGGFGCDHEDRTELLRVGAERGARVLGATRAECRVVVVGDTVRDVTAAHGIGALCVGVETGGVSAETLRAAGADAVFRDLSESGVLDAVLELTR